MLQLKEICPLQMNTHATIIIQLCYILEMITDSLTPSLLALHVVRLKAQCRAAHVVIASVLFFFFSFSLTLISFKFKNVIDNFHN